MGNWVSLKDVCSKGSSSLRQKDLHNAGRYPVYGAAGVVGFLDNYQYDRDYVAVIKDGAGVGRVLLCSAYSSVLGTLQPIIPNESITLSYLRFLLSGMHLADYSSGATIPHIYFKDYGESVVNLPDIEEQKAISCLFERILQQIKLAEQMLAKTDELIQSRFVEMFGDPINNPFGLPIVIVGDVLSVQPANGLYKPQRDYVTDMTGTPIVRIDSFRSEGPDYASLKRLNCSHDEIRRYGLAERDIVINRVNSVGCMGKTMLVKNMPEPVVFESNMMRLHSDESRILPEFLCAQMTMEQSKFYFESHAKRAIGQASINQKDVKQLPILLPSIAAQAEYLEFVTQVESLKSATRQQLDRLNILYDSLAQRHFAE